jgi:putative ABC transport system substrate-binding protein
MHTTSGGKGRMAIHIRRREFIFKLGGAAAAWPLAARAQQPAMSVVGYLHQGVPEGSSQTLAAFREGLSETGYVEGQNVAIEYRWARNEVARLSDLAADLVRRRVAVIAMPVSTPAALAAKAATATIPIVFAVGADPVALGLVASLNRPGGNVTGVASMGIEIATKRLGLLQELLPRAARFAVLVNPANPNAEPYTKDLQAAAAAVGRQIEVLPASTNRDIDAAFANLGKRRADALLVAPDTLFTNRRVQFATLGARYLVPALYNDRRFSEAGGLMSYGANIMDITRHTGIYVGRILKGEKPADLPVLRATKFEFVINLQTATALGLDVPTKLLALADEVIE